MSSDGVGQGTAVAVGMFDGVHLGHQHMLRLLRERAAERGLRPVAVTFAAHPLELIAPERAPKILTPLPSKLELLSQYGRCEAHVLSFTESLRALTAREFLAMLRESLGVRYVLAGYNHRFGCDGDSCGDYAVLGRELGITVERAEEYVAPELGESISSSAVRRNLAAGGVEMGSAMLGRPYEVSGTVAHGRGLGHTIGFPTANLQPDSPSQLVPGTGVYACQARVGEMWLPAMTNIGTRPTVSGHASRIEAHIIGLDADLYGLPIALRFLHRLRDEKAFPSIEALRAQLKLDREAVKSRRL